MKTRLIRGILSVCLILSLMTGICAAEEDWNAQYDVVVIGFGGAGASAAIEAADAGAKVLVLEKAPKTAAGGNTRVCGQQVLSPTDVDMALQYFDAIFAGYIYDKEIVKATTEGMSC